MALQEKEWTLHFSVCLRPSMLTQSPPHSRQNWSATQCWCVVFIGGGQTLSVAPRGSLCVCWCRVCVYVRVCVCVCVSDTLLWVPVCLAVFPTVYLPALTRKQHNSREGFTSILLPFAAKKPKSWLQNHKTPLLKLHSSPASGSPNIKSMQAEINPTLSYRQDLGFFSKDCLSSFSLSSGRNVTEILRSRLFSPWISPWDAAG